MKFVFWVKLKCDEEFNYTFLPISVQYFDGRTVREKTTFVHGKI